MDEVYGCAEVRPLLAELATGAVAGHERASALRHVAGCRQCRSDLADLAKVADGLLLLAPRTEPPPGFESAVVARLGTDARPPRHRVWLARPRRVFAGALVALVAAASGGLAVWWHTGPDRRLAGQTRQTLSVANGRYLHAAHLLAAGGQPAGTVFLYQGEPSWLLVSVFAAPTDGSYEVVLVSRDGARYPIGACQVADGAGTTAYSLTGSVASVARVELTGPAGVRLNAHH